MFEALIINLILHTLIAQTDIVVPANNFIDSNLSISPVISRPARINNTHLGVKLSAKSALVVDVESNKILFQKNPREVLPIASLTKLMTALVFLEEQKVDWGKPVTVSKRDRSNGSQIYLQAF